MAFKIAPLFVIATFITAVWFFYGNSAESPMTINITSDGYVLNGEFSDLNSVYLSMGQFSGSSLEICIGDDAPAEQVRVVADEARRMGFKNLGFRSGGACE